MVCQSRDFPQRYVVIPLAITMYKQLISQLFITWIPTPFEINNFNAPVYLVFLKNIAIW